MGKRKEWDWKREWDTPITAVEASLMLFAGGSLARGSTTTAIILIAAWCLLMFFSSD